MGGIALPALGVKPVQTPDPLEQLGRIGALQQQQQGIQAGALENKQRQMALRDEQAMTTAMQSWDGKDVDQLPGLVIKNGGSAKAVLGLKSQLLQQKKTYSEMAKDDSEAGKNNLATQISINDQMAGRIGNVLTLPDGQLSAGVQQAGQEALQQKLLDPQHAQGISQLTQLPPDQLRQKLTFLQKSYMGQQAQQEAALKGSEIQKNTTETLLNQNKVDVINAWKSNPQQVLGQVDNIVPAAGPNAALNARTKAQVQFALGNGDVDGAKAAIKQAAEQVGAVEKDVAVATNPQIQAGKVAVATAEGQARANIEAAQARGSSAALAQVPPHLVAPASAAATKAGEDYAQAQSVTERLNAMMDAARKGNVVSYQVIPEEGTLQITTSQGVHRINQAEIQQYAGGGSLWQRLMGHVGKTLSGASIPSSVLDDMAEIQKIQSQGSQLKYNNSLKTINQNYGASFKPVEMDKMNSVTSKAAPTVGAIEGGYKFKGGDPSKPESWEKQ